MTKQPAPTPIRFSEAQKKHLKRRAKEQRHGKLSRVVKDLVNRDMEGAA